ncbi:hypothetical protein BGW41_007599 [Actinomortierella wolfii]|nr:hypothetical protein BGW41_007599 [Actinomortierella wolfii]
MDPADQLGIVRDIMEQHLKHDEQQRQQQQQQQQEQEQQTIAALQQQSAHVPLEAVTVDALQAHHHHHHHHDAIQVESANIHHHHQHHHQHHDESHAAMVEAARAVSVIDQDMTAAASSPSSSAVPSVGTPSATPVSTSTPAFASTFHTDTSPLASVTVSEAAVAVAASMSSQAFAEATAMLESVRREHDATGSGPSSSTPVMGDMSIDHLDDEYDSCPKILRLPVDQWETWLEEQQKKCRWNMTRFRSRDKPIAFARGPTASEWTREFQCIHAGAYRDRKNPNINPKKKRNRGKSIKVGCTAFIKMRKMFNEDTVHIEYGWQHKNHSLDVIDDIRNQRLPYDLKNWIKQRVLDGSNWKTVKSILLANDSPLLEELNPTTREHVHLIITQCYGHYANVARQLKKKHGVPQADSPAERNNRGTIIQFELEENAARHPSESSAAVTATTATWNLTSDLSGQTLAIQSLATLQGAEVPATVAGGPANTDAEAAAAAAAVAMEIAGDPSEEIQRRLRELQEVTVAQESLEMDVSEPTARVLAESAVRAHAEPATASVHTGSTVRVVPETATRVLTHHEALAALTAAATTPTPTPATSSPVIEHHPGSSNASSMDVDSTHDNTEVGLVTSQDKNNLAAAVAAHVTDGNNHINTAASIIPRNNTSPRTPRTNASTNSSVTPRTPRANTSTPNIGLPHARDQMRDILREIRQLESQMESTVQYTSEEDAVRIIESFRLPIRLMKEAPEWDENLHGSPRPSNVVQDDSLDVQSNIVISDDTEAILPATVKNALDKISWYAHVASARARTHLQQSYNKVSKLTSNERDPAQAQIDELTSEKEDKIQSKQLGPQSKNVEPTVPHQTESRTKKITSNTGNSKQQSAKGEHDEEGDVCLHQQAKSCEGSRGARLVKSKTLQAAKEHEDEARVKDSGFTQTEETEEGEAIEDGSEGLEDAEILDVEYEDDHTMDGDEEGAAAASLTQEKEGTRRIMRDGEDEDDEVTPEERIGREGPSETLDDEDS